MIRVMIIYDIPDEKFTEFAVFNSIGSVKSLGEIVTGFELIEDDNLEQYLEADKS